LTSPRRGTRAPVTILAAFLGLVLTLSASAARAELKLQPADPTAPPAYVPPGAVVTAEPSPPPQPITRKWWLWAAVGAAVVTTVVVVVVATREPSPPGSTLGNMNAFMGK
jgi:hypothetical protein